LNVAWSRLLLQSLHQAGAESVVLSPGSRSAPLTCAAADLAVPLFCAVDERAAGFFALGRARVTGAPAILICTSGTAGAHYYPAVIEAHYACLPLVVVTADRPPELHGCGANQTVRQQRLFGDHVRYCADLGTPNFHPQSLAGLRRRAAQVVAAALGPPPGPVHINVPMRKPLEPTAEDAQQAGAIERILAEPICRRVAPHPNPPADEIRALAADLAGGCTCIVAGPAPLAQERARAAINALATRGAMPLFAEATSQLRFTGPDRNAFHCDQFELALSAPSARRFTPNAVLELGGTPTSNAYGEFAAERPGMRRYVISPDGWPDPLGGAALLIAAQPGAVARELVRVLPSANDGQRAFAAAASVLEKRARLQLAGARRRAVPLCELAAVEATLSALPDRALVGLGNSSPVRLADLVAGDRARLRIWSQRGASGIDGLVAGAAGAASADGGPNALLLGDVSLAHDVAGLALAREVTTPLAIVVLDNGGGRLFEQLPIAAALRRRGQDALFSRLFLTPPHFDLAAICAGFGVSYARAESTFAVSAAVHRASSAGGCTVVHAVVRGSTAELLAAARSNPGANHDQNSRNLPSDRLDLSARLRRHPL
jgi:2-succinyl-5-enolpyruvyl-6-hydroxy-3-cyclohexene-1-carboxylate synthase